MGQLPEIRAGPLSALSGKYLKFFRGRWRGAVCMCVHACERGTFTSAQPACTHLSVGLSVQACTPAQTRTGGLQPRSASHPGHTICSDSPLMSACSQLVQGGAVDPGSCFVLCWAESVTDAWPGLAVYQDVPSQALVCSAQRTRVGRAAPLRRWKPGLQGAGSHPVVPPPLGTVSSHLCALSAPKGQKCAGTNEGSGSPIHSLCGWTYLVRVKVGQGRGGSDSRA